MDFGFRPLTGDLSSLQAKKVAQLLGLDKFPSPYRGLIFLTSFSKIIQKVVDVSVPLQGTYLPYVVFIFACVRKWLVSVPLQGTYLPYSKTLIGSKNLPIVSVPLQGTYLPYVDMRLWMGNVMMFPSPYRGLIFLTHCLEVYNNDKYRFRPLTGDLSSLL